MHTRETMEPGPRVEGTERLAALRRLEILDTEPEQDFDELVQLAAELLDVPTAMLNFIDEDRQWAKAAHGWPQGAEAPRSDALCAHAIERPGETMVVSDASRDARFAGSSYVASGLRFYAGVPVTDDDGHPLGALCVLDNRAREPSEQQLRKLEIVGRSISRLLALRSKARRLQTTVANLDAVLEHAPDAYVSITADGRVVEWNRRAEEIFGYARLDAVGRQLEDLIIPASLRPAHQEELARVATEGARRLIGRAVEVNASRADGSEVPIELTLAVVAEGDVVRFNAFCRDISDRKASEREREDHARALAALSQVSSELARKTDTAALTAIVCQAAADVTDAAGAVLFHPDADRGLIATASTLSHLAGARVPAGTPSAALDAIRDGTPVVVGDVTRDARIFEALRAHAARSVIAYPVTLDGRAEAVLEVWWTTPIDAVRDRTLQLLSMLANEIAAAMERASLFGRLDLLSRTDELTGIPNRRALDAELRRRLRDPVRPLTFVMLDLDNFKAFNDMRGHARGDRLLRACATAWQAALRDGDILARYGGEEFAVLLAACPATEAQAIVARLRAATPDGQTVSAGIAHWDTRETAGALIERADAALYAAKRHGRDTAVFAPVDG